MKRDHGRREMFLWGFLLAQVACAERWAVHAGVTQAGVTCPAAPPERRVADGGLSREDGQTEELQGGLSMGAMPAARQR